VATSEGVLPSEAQVSSEQRHTLEREYEVAFQKFEMENRLVWQTFSIVSTLALAGLAFIGQLKTGEDARTWPATIAVGLAMITILVGWLALARRWWAYGQHELHRMREIETLLGMYLVREGTWLRERQKAQQEKPANEERARYQALLEAFPDFPGYRWRQRVLVSFIVGGLVVIWLLLMLCDVLRLI